MLKLRSYLKKEDNENKKFAFRSTFERIATLFDKLLPF